MTTDPKRASNASANVDGGESDGEADVGTSARSKFVHATKSFRAPGRGEEVVGRVRVHVERWK